MVQFYIEELLQNKHDEVFSSCVPAERPLPPKLDKGQFDIATAEFTKIVGEEHVVLGKDLINFRDPYPLDTAAHLASAAVW
jgi:hypothetical protein